MVAAVKLIALPEQTGLLLETVGAAAVFIVTAVVAADEVHPLTVWVTEYVPVFAEVTLVILGFWVVEV